MIYSTSGRSGPTVAIRPDGTGDITDTNVVWRSSRGGPHVPSPVLWDDLLYLVNDTGILTCLDAVTGKTVYQQRLRGRFTASLAAAAGRLYCTNERGDTYVVRCGREHELIAVNPLEESVLASPAILDGRLYIRGEMHLFAIGA
jgi:outer membrane protein assembly factor BamB